MMRWLHIAIFLLLSWTARSQCTDYTFNVTSGNWPSEVYWEMYDSNGNLFLSGFAGESYTLCLEDDDWEIYMYDSFGDGWNGAEWQLICPNGLVISSGTLNSGLFDVGLMIIDGGLCSGDLGCSGSTDGYFINVSAGTFPGEVAWNILDEFGNVLTGGGAPYFGFVCLDGGCFSIEMADMFGDGWNGSVITITDELGNVVTDATLSFGSYQTVPFGTEGTPCAISCPPGENAYTLEVTDGTSPIEIWWTVIYYGTPIAQGGAGTTTSLCLMDDCYSILMEDWWGNGWNGAVYNLYDTNGNLVYTGTIDTGYGATNNWGFGGADCGGGGTAVTAGDCFSAVDVCENLNFTIDPNGWGTINEIPSLGTIGNPDLMSGDGVPSPGGSDNYGCLRAGELNSTWMVVNIWQGGMLEFSFGANGAQSGFYDWIMYPYDSLTSCGSIPIGNIAPVRCNWNGTSTGGTGLAATPPPGGSTTNYEAPLAVNQGEQYLIVFSNYSSVFSVVPLDFGGTAVVGCFPLILPVELVEFTAEPKDHSVVIEWTTVSEHLSDYYEVQHSLDGSVWETIGWRDASGESQELLHYELTHPQPHSGWNYYRLKQVDSNGQWLYSENRGVQFKGETTQIQPNPNTGTFQVSMQPSDIIITDLQGKKIYFDASKMCDQCPTTVTLSQAAPGVYILYNAVTFEASRIVIEMR